MEGILHEPIPSSVATLTSLSGKRMHPRVELPLEIVLDGREYRTKDLSLGGFGLAGDGPREPVGKTLKASLRLSLVGVTTLLDIPARVVWLANDRARGFQFIGLLPEQARLINAIVRNHLASEPARPADLALQAGDPKILLRNPAGSNKKSLARTLRTGVMLSLSLALFGALAAYVGTRLLTVTSDYAAVASTLRQVRAPESGYLETSALVVGARLRAGQVIGFVRPAVSPQVQLQVESQIAELHSARELQLRAAAEAKEGFGNFVRVARSDLEAASAARNLLEAQTATAQRMLQRVSALATTGTASKESLDRQTQAFLNSQQSLAAARDAELVAQQKVKSAEAGHFVSDGRSTQKSPADLERDVAATQAQLNRLESMRAGLDQALPIHSPCDCVVSAVNAASNVFVAADDQIADLAEASDGQVQVDALIQSKNLGLVRIGQSAKVYLASHGEAQPGRVTAVNFNPASSGRTGLPDTARFSDNYGIMTVTLEGAAAQTETGLPAIVMAPLDGAVLLRNLPALAWASDLLHRWLPRPRTSTVATTWTQPS